MIRVKLLQGTLRKIMLSKFYYAELPIFSTANIDLSSYFYVLFTRFSAFHICVLFHDLHNKIK